jgi:hypothetical protein
MKRAPLARATALSALVVVLVVGCSGGAPSSAPQGSTPGYSVSAALATSGSSPAAATASPDPVPAEYQPLYDQLSTELQDLQGRASAHTGSPTSPPVFGAELLGANGNIGAALLKSTTLSGIGITLDRMEQMGVRGVTVDVAFPLLTSTFPDHAAYLTFYEQVAAAVKAHNMILSVEENPVFARTQYSSVTPDYSGMTIASYAAAQREQAQLIVDNLQPAYLSILDEPDTFSGNLHLSLDSAPSAVAVVKSELTGLRRGTTKIGAGTGTWSDPAIDQALAAQTSIDYLSVHVYPIDHTSVDNLDQVSTISIQTGKPIVLDETWLYKSEGPGLVSAAAASQAFQLDTFGFFEPLDQRFLAAMTAYARNHGFLYVSPFWSGQFFGYLHWTPALDVAGYSALKQQANQSQSPNIVANRLSALGSSYEAEIR